MPKHRVYILLGSNLGERENYLATAQEQIQLYCGRLVKESALYETAAWGKQDQAAFLNKVIVITTGQQPDELMQHLLHIEETMGRTRGEKMGPRIIDLDILFYDQLVYTSRWVTIPHPLLQERRFVLIPMAEVAARKVHPVYKKTIQTLLTQCSDSLNVKKF